jgi:hypothetical protein
LIDVEPVKRADSRARWAWFRNVANVAARPDGRMVVCSDDGADERSDAGEGEGFMASLKHNKIRGL